MKRLFCPCLLLVVAAVALAQGKADVPALVKQLKDKDALVRLKAARELAKLGPAAKEALPALKDALKDDDEDVRAVAKRAIQAIGDTAEANPKLADLTKALKDKANANRLKALEGLAKLGPDAKDADRAIVTAMLERWPMNKEEYLGALEKVHPEIHKQVVTFLVDEELRNKSEAVELIAKMRTNGRAAVPLFLAFYQADKAKNFPNGNVISATIMESLGVVDPEGVDSVKTILDGIARPVDPQDLEQASEIRKRAIKSSLAMKIDGKILTKALIAGMADKDCIIEAINALAKLGPTAKEAVPVLNKAKLDSRAEVREAATAALEKINK